mgnify:CR=1 FL=1
MDGRRYKQHRSFLPTPSARRVTEAGYYFTGGNAISTHTLCEEGDSFLSLSTTMLCYFYPHPLRGG